MTLDAGALIAAERNDRRFWVWWKWVTERGVVASLPAPVLAQAWRGARSARVAVVSRGCRVVAMGEDGARRAGELCAAAGTADVVDAFVVAGAAARGEDVVTSDPDDLRRLAPHAPGVGRIRTLAELGAG